MVTAAALAVAREVAKEVAAQAVPEAEAAAGSERLRMRLVAAARHPFRNTFNRLIAPSGGKRPLPSMNKSMRQ